MSDAALPPRPPLLRGLPRLLLAVSMATACADDGTGDTTGSEGVETHCSDGACTGGSTSATSTSTGSGGPSSEAGTTMPAGEGTTASSNGDGSSTGPDACAADTCGACFSCTYDGACQQAQSQCSVDPACSIALICVRDCIEQAADPTTCVAACDCPADGPLPALLECATGICVPNGSCPALSC